MDDDPELTHTQPCNATIIISTVFLLLLCSACLGPSVARPRSLLVDHHLTALHIHCGLYCLIRPLTALAPDAAHSVPWDSPRRSGQSPKTIRPSVPTTYLNGQQLLTRGVGSCTTLPQLFSRLSLVPTLANFVCLRRPTQPQGTIQAQEASQSPPHIPHVFRPQSRFASLETGSRPPARPPRS